MEEKTIYDLKLHENYRISDNVWAQRVPGGWLYVDLIMSDETTIVGYTSTFVPYNKEFNNKLNK